MLAQDKTPDWDGLALDRHWIGILLASDLNLNWRWIGTASVPDWDRCAPYWHRIETGLTRRDQGLELDWKRIGD